MTTTEEALVAACNFMNSVQELTFLNVADLSVEQAMPQLIDQIAKSIPLIEPNERYWVAFRCFIFSKWSKFKTVYRLDPDFYEMLIDTEDTVFYQDSLKHLPYDCIFVPDPTGEMIGRFIYLEFTGTDSTFTILEVDEVKDNHITKYGIASTIVHDRQTIHESIQENLQDMKRRVGEDELSKYPEGFIETQTLQSMLLCIQICYYLAAQNAELKEVKIKKGKRPKKKDGKPLNIRQWDVGYRIGNDFRKERSDSESTSSRTSSRPRPHVRRAHWHHFWCGPNKSQLELKWLAPIFVNTNEDKDNIVSTEHRVL